MNFSNICTGKWTHDIHTTGVSSVLDYFIANDDMARQIDEKTIYETCMNCPFKTSKKGEVHVTTFSDHNPIISKASIKHRKKNKQPTKFQWKKRSDTFCKTRRCNKPIITNNPQENYNIMEDKINSIMFQTFCKR